MTLSGNRLPGGTTDWLRSDDWYRVGPQSKYDWCPYEKRRDKHRGKLDM